MKVTEALREEHVQVLRLVACLEKLAHETAERGQLDGTAAVPLLRLFESFVDDRHQTKEEGVLFPELLRAAGKIDTQLVLDLLADHEEELLRLRAMRGNVLAAIFGEPNSVRAFVEDARAYARLQREHMLRENHGLFTIADRLLTPEGEAEVLTGFAEIDARGDGSPEEVRAAIADLCEQLGTDEPAVA